MEGYIRNPVVAGMFYPGSKDTLNKMIHTLLLNVSFKSREDKILFGLISPHAGYIYSGKTAAFGYNLLKNRNYDTVIVIGPSHQTYLIGASVWARGIYKTPLGEVEIDEEATEYLLEHEFIEFNQIAHMQEHSIEVQVPFLQYVLKNNFKFVPIIIGNQNYEFAKKLSDTLFSLYIKLNKKILFIASSDLSHYHSAEVAERLDKNVIDAIKNMKPEEVEKVIEEGKGEACGYGPIMCLLCLAEQVNANHIDILDVTNSGETSGDYTRVVGYMSAAIYK